jgi:hypothetical protein
MKPFQQRGQALQRGQVLPLIGLCLAVLMGFGGVAVDVGYLEYQQQSQQNATDAAAIGGAEQLAHGACANQSVAKAAAVADAASNGFSSTANTTVTANSPPLSGVFAGNACAVSVAINSSHVSTWFSRLFGFSQGVAESTQGTALVSSAGNGACIYLLSPTVSANFNGANIYAPECSVAINATANFNGATIYSPHIGYAGATPNENGSSFTLASPAPMLPVADPCSEIAGCNYLTSNPQSTSNCTNFNGNGYNGALAAGCYSSLNLNGATVTMSGTYVLSGTSNFNGAKLTGTNVTLYVPSSGTAPNFNGATVNLTAPTTGSMANMLYYQIPSNTSSPNFNGTSNKYSGVIYCPGATSANFNGASGGYVVLVFGSWNYNGSSAVDFATPPPGGSFVKQAVLAQ